MVIFYTILIWEWCVNSSFLFQNLFLEKTFFELWTILLDFEAG